MSSNSKDSPLVMKALDKLYNSLSSEDQQTFLARSIASSSPASEPLTGEHLTAMQADGDTNEHASSPTQTGITKGPATKRRQVLNDRKKKKPLNAFLTYRSYYSPIFSGLTQKAKSAMVRKLWAEEPRKQLFTLVGQAYSELRDNDITAGLDKEFFKKFIPIVVAALPIIPADKYLDAMGWTRHVDHDGLATLERSGTAGSVPNESMRTNWSVADIVEYCYKIGLVARPVRGLSRPRRTAAGAISFATAPTISAALRRELWPNVETPAIDAQVAAQLSSTFAPEFDFSDLSTTPSIEQVTADQQQAFEQFPMPMHFHPAIQPPVLGFDPNLIQDNFDPYSFDIDQYLNFDK